MRSFLPTIVSTAAVLSIPCANAFVTPSTNDNVVGGVITERYTQLSAIKSDTSNYDDVPSRDTTIHKSITSTLAAATILLGTVTPAFAVSGGGLDFAGTNISEKDFSSQNLKGKDFTQVIGKFADFSKANLQGCRFFGAVLIDSNFEGADATGVSFEKGQMDGANFKNIKAVGGYFSQSLLDVKTLEGGDFTDATIPEKTQMLICEREDTKGTNPMTGVDTRESLMCLD